MGTYGGNGWCVGLADVQLELRATEGEGAGGGGLPKVGGELRCCQDWASFGLNVFLTEGLAMYPDRIGEEYIPADC